MTAPATERVGVAVVTGAAGGIGTQVCRRLLAEGYRVIAVGRSPERLTALRDELGAELVPAPCDLTDETQVGELAARTGPVQVLVNNAGDSAAAAVIDESLDNWRYMFEANATSAFLATRAFLPAMLANRWGRVVFVASTSSIHGDRFVGSYVAAKHAVLGLARAVAAELTGSGVTSNAVCPAYVRTPMTERNVRRIAAESGRSETEVGASLYGRSPLGRLIEPAEVAAAVAYFISADAGAINGQSLVIDGGRLQA